MARIHCLASQGHIPILAQMIYFEVEDFLSRRCVALGRIDRKSSPAVGASPLEHLMKALIYVNDGGRRALTGKVRVTGNFIGGFFDGSCEKSALWGGELVGELDLDHRLIHRDGLFALSFSYSLGRFVLGYGSDLPLKESPF